MAECLPSPPTVLPLSPTPLPACSKGFSGCFCPFQFDRMLPPGYINTTYIYRDPLSPTVRRSCFFYFLPQTQANVFPAFCILPVILGIDKLFIQVEQRKHQTPRPYYHPTPPQSSPLHPQKHTTATPEDKLFQTSKNKCRNFSYIYNIRKHLRKTTQSSRQTYRLHRECLSSAYYQG